MDAITKSVLYQLRANQLESDGSSDELASGFVEFGRDAQPAQDRDNAFQIRAGASAMLGGRPLGRVDRGVSDDFGNGSGSPWSPPCEIARPRAWVEAGDGDPARFGRTAGAWSRAERAHRTCHCADACPSFVERNGNLRIGIHAGKGPAALHVRCCFVHRSKIRERQR